jgi:signal transduction histidine kinase
VAEQVRDPYAIRNSGDSLLQLLDPIIDIATRLLSTSSGAIYCLYPDQKILVAQATRGLPAADASKRTFPADKSLLEQAMVKQQPMIISDISATLAGQKDGLRQQLQATPAEHYHTVLAAPLLGRGQFQEDQEVYGVLTLHYPEARTFSDEEIRLAMTFATQAALVIENTQLHKRVEQTAAEMKGGRLARELYDSIAQSLYSMTLMSEGWRRMARNGTLTRVEEHFGELGELCRQVSKEVRLLAYDLLAPAPDREGLLGALCRRISTMELRAGVDARVIVHETIELPLHHAATLHGVAVEMLNDALMHTGATTVTIHLRMTGNNIILEVENDGKGEAVGIDHTQGRPRLSTVREHVEQLGGTLSIQCVSGERTRVCVQVPMPPTSTSVAANAIISHTLYAVAAPEDQDIQPWLPQDR